MPVPSICKKSMITFLISLLISCGGLHTQPDEQPQKDTAPPLVNISPTPVISLSSQQRQEYMYKFLVAEVAVQRGTYDLAARYFIDIAKKFKNPRFAERATQIAMYINAYDLALQTARTWVTIEPTHSNARQLLVNLLLHAGQVDEALTHLEIVLKAFKDDPEKRLQILALLVEQPLELDAVLALIRKLLVKRPNDLNVLIIYAHLLIKDNKIERATKIVKQLLDIDPNHEQGVLLHAHILDKQDKVASALKWLKKKLADKSTNEEWRLLYARLLVKHEAYPEAINQFEHLLAKKPNEPEIIYTLGSLTLQIEELSLAKGYFNQLLNYENFVDIARYHLGQIAEQEDNLTEALRWYRAVERDKFRLSAQVRVAAILFEQGRVKEGQEHLRSISGLNQEESLALTQAEANLLVEQERFAEAMAIYDKALEKEENIDLLYMRAMLADQMGQLDLLEQDLRRILTLAPDNVEALNALGYTLADRTQRYQEAYQLINKALTLTSEAKAPFHILDSMGWVLYRLKKYEEAIIYLRKAQAKQNDPEVAAHLGEVLWVSGRYDQAKEVWNEALKLFPDDEKLQAVMQKFLKHTP